MPFTHYNLYEYMSFLYVIKDGQSDLSSTIQRNCHFTQLHTNLFFPRIYNVSFFGCTAKLHNRSLRKNKKNSTYIVSLIGSQSIRYKKAYR